MSSFSQSRIAWCQNELSQRSNSSTALTGQLTLTTDNMLGSNRNWEERSDPGWQQDHCDRWFNTTWYRIASMQNVLGDGRWTQRGEVVCECRLAVQQLEGVGVQSRGGARPVPPWRTLWPPPFPTPGKAWCTLYICGMWVLPAQQPEQTRLCKLCPIRLPLILFSILSSIILW